MKGFQILICRDAGGCAWGAFPGQKAPHTPKIPINILCRLRRFIKLRRVAPASSHCYRVESSSKPFFKRFLYIFHGYKCPLKFAWRLPSPSGENARTQVSSRRVCKQTLVTDEGLNSLCHTPSSPAVRELSRCGSVTREDAPSSVSARHLLPEEKANVCDLRTESPQKGDLLIHHFVVPSPLGKAYKPQFTIQILICRTV